jgi:hypothetical protein
VTFISLIAQRIFVILTLGIGNINIIILEMLTGEIHILPSDSTPEFRLCSDGMFKIRGRGLYKNRTEDIGQVQEWIDEYLENPAEVTYVVIAFEYLNSLSTILIVSILRRLQEVILKSKKLVIQWYFEEDDEDMYERGEYISMSFDIPITFIPATHITDL